MLVDHDLALVRIIGSVDVRTLFSVRVEEHQIIWIAETCVLVLVP